MNERNVKKRSQRNVVAAAFVFGTMFFFALIVHRPPQSAKSKPVSDVAEDEQIVFFPSHASYDAAHDEWIVHVHAWWFESETGSRSRRLTRAAIRKFVGLPKNDETARERFDRRIGRFLADGERGKTLTIQLGEASYALTKTDKSGHCEMSLRLGKRDVAELSKNEADAGWIPLRAVLKADDSRRFAGAVLPISASGLSVVSDIDDTIKITNVTNRDEMLANSLYRPFRPVEGMPALYRELEKRGAVFHYVSGSPWQLYEPLTEFITKQRFPRGTMHLRRFRLKDVRSLPDIAKPTGKQQAIESLLAEFPQRRFLLFGDSGERDPEIYGGLARKHPNQIVGIFIRNVTGKTVEGARLKAAFRGIARDRWMLFAKPQAAKAIAIHLAKVPPASGRSAHDGK